MSQCIPTPAEMSTIEQIETALHDDELNVQERNARLCALWRLLERAHGGKVLHLVSPEGDVIDRPPFDVQFFGPGNSWIK